MLLSVLLQAAAAGVGVTKLGAALGAGLAVIGAGLGIGSFRRYPYEHDYCCSFDRGCCPSGCSCMFVGIPHLICKTSNLYMSDRF